MSGLWLSLAIRQLLRTLGQHRAIVPMLVIALLTIPTAIVAVDRMAPHAHTVFHRLGPLAGERLVYGFALLMGVLLFPLQLQLLQELDSSREIENLERFPLPRRALYHFKLIDQWVMFLPLLLLALGVALAGGLFHLTESRREFRERTLGRARGVLAAGEAPTVDAAKAAMGEALARAQRVGFFHAEGHLARELAAMEARGVPERERRRAAFIDRDRTRTMLALAAERTIEATVSLAEKRPLATQVAFALALWEDQVGLVVRAHGVPSSIDDLEPPSRRLWAELGFGLPLGSRARAVLAVLLVLVAVGVQLGLMFVIAFGVGLVPERAIRRRGVIVLAVAVFSLAAIVAILVAIPGMRRAAALGPYAPWALVARTVAMVELGEWRLALAPAALFLAQLVVLYELAGCAYRANLLERRERINARIARLMSPVGAAVRVGRDLLTGPMVRLLGEPIGLYVAKDVRQITRPPINRLMIAMLVFPFGCLAAFVAARLVLVRPPNPFDGRALGYYGLAAMLLAFYGLLTLFWIPCTQIFLFGYERWGLALVWYAPQSARQLYRGKAVAAGLVIAPAVALAFGGMALFIAVGGSPGWGRMGALGLVFVGVTAYVFGHIVASLGILFPYYLQTRFRHLAGGMGFMMQLSLVPAWVATWIFGLVCVMYFGATGVAILTGAIAVWAGFARILAREAVEALDRIGREYGHTGDARPAPAVAPAGIVA